MKIKKMMALGLCGAVMVSAAGIARADSGTSGTTDNRELLEKIKQLEQRVTELEGKSTQQVAAAKSIVPQKTLDFLGQTELSGFVSASYLYDFNSTHGSKTVADRTFDTHANQFALNKFKLALEKPIDYNPTNWLVGYRADLIFGEDAAVIHSSGFNLGNDGDLEQAFVDINVPIGNGLKVIIGKTVTLMGLEVIEEVSNPNWSEGNQFLYVENFTQTGVQLAYKWNDKLDTEFVVFNGWDQLPDNNSGPSFMGRIGYAPDANDSIGLLGYGGPEQTTTSLGGTGTTANWRDGAEVLFNHKFSDKFNSYLQLDYGQEQKVIDNGNSEWYAAGLWLVYDFTDKIELAFRQDYLKDSDGTRTGMSPLSPELSSSTLTLNLKPVDNFQFRPEIRWDHSDKDAFNNNRDQFTLGVSVAYLY
ncbi:MAG TPA: outer membrane beta-barrel protein [Verrucomicrobiae bacterium]|nr:outer membrane beta-barrel protein [Verrucomicrobiae bacterium]